MSLPPGQPDPDLPVQPGAILAGKYRVERVIGRGGMGVVVEARHVALDERVALKLLLPEYAQHPEASARFQREARAAVKIKGEHVARVSDVGTLEGGSPYMVMEMLEGIDLSRALEQHGVCQIPDAIDYVLQACEAIAEAHAHGIIHRDLKPANMFLTRRPDGTPMVKVLDFGISKMSGSGVDNLTRTTASMGSALYMSPEQMQQTRGVDLRTDVYALGISLYELLAGKQPYYADTLPQLCAAVLTGTPTPIQQLRAEVSGGLAAVLEKAYAREKESRYQSVAELSAGLAPYAPTRSQSMLDRIARMAGTTPPVAGGDAQKAPPPASDPARSASDVAAASQSALPAQTGTFAQQDPPISRAGDLQRPITFVTPSIAIGGYQGPMSVKAAAAFAAGAAASTGMSSTSGPSKPHPSKVGVALVAAAFILLLAASGVAFWWRLRFGSGAAATPLEIGTSTTSAPATTSAPIAPTSATPAITGDPTPAAAISGAASTGADPAPSATPAVLAPASASAPTSSVARPTPPTKTAPPATATKKPGVMTSR